MAETLADARKDIAEMAVDAFKNHRVQRLAPHLWKCSAPGTWVYGFFVAALPGALVFYGDLGEAILRPHDTDVIPWLRGAVHSEGYLLEKVQPHPEEAFYQEDALAWAAESLAEAEADAATAGPARVGRANDKDPVAQARQLLEEARDKAHWGDLNAHTWAELVYETTGDSEACSVGSGPSSRSLWLVQALRWFVAHLDEATTPEQAAGEAPACAS